MNEQQNLRCVRCGHNPKEPVVVPQYSDTARHFLRPDDSEPIRSIDDESDEAALLREELQRGRDLLSSADKDIAMLQAMLGDLRAKRDLLKKFVDDHAAILSRVCLPPELLVKIFHLAYPVVNTNVKKGIWQLGRVCSYWRSVLSSSPSLWSAMDLDWTSTVPVTEEILSLSGNSPLRITLTIVSSKNIKKNKKTPVLLGAVLAASHRWYAITFSISDSRPLVSLLNQLNQLKGRIPLLTEVICNDGISLDWLQGAPSLQKLDISDINDSESIVALPWSQLRELNCSQLTLDQEYQILRQCVNLETYTFVPRRLTGPLPFDLLCMSKLRTLTVVISSGEGRATSMDVLSNLLSRSHCFPTKLKISTVFKNSGVLRFFSLVSLQNLTTLHVSCTDNLQLVSSLTLHPETENSVILLPRLENLHLRPYSVDLDDLTPVIDMVRSRWHIHERVEVASRLAFFAFIPIARLQNLRGALSPLLDFSEEGLEMDIDRFYLKNVE